MATLHRLTPKKGASVQGSIMAHYSFSAHFQVTILHSERSLTQELQTILISLFAIPPSRGRSEAPTTMSRSSTPAGSVYLFTVLPLFDLFSGIFASRPNVFYPGICTFGNLCSNSARGACNELFAMHSLNRGTHTRASACLWSIVQPRNGEQETR